MAKERTLGQQHKENQEKLEAKLIKLSEFINKKQKDNENNPDTRKLYDAAQKVIEALKNLKSQSVEIEKNKESAKDQESKDDEKEQDTKAKTEEVIGRVLPSLERFMNEEKEDKSKEERLKKEQAEKEEKEKKTKSEQDLEDPELKKKKEAEEEQERKRKLEKEEEEQKKEKEEKKLEQALKETLQTIQQILEYEKKLREDARGKETGNDLDIIGYLKKTLPALENVTGKTESKDGLKEKLGNVLDIFKRIDMQNSEEGAKKSDAIKNKDHTKDHTRE